MTAEASTTPAGSAPTRNRSPKRETRSGVVTSAARQKTIRVMIEYLVRHAKYGKFLRRRTVFHAHDEKGECRVGDQVEIMECRPLSKTKRWRLVRVIQRAPRAQGAEA